MSPIRDDDRPKGASWKPWVLGCVGVPLLLVAGCLALAGGAFFWARGSMPNRMALERARHNPAVREALGTPLRIGFASDTNVQANVSGPDGSTSRTSITHPISGPKGKGTLSVVAEKRKGHWHYEKLSVTIEKTGQVIDLLAPGER